MPIGDQVSFDPYADGSEGGPFGVVIAEDAGPPLNADVLWEDGVIGSAIPQASLRKVFRPPLFIIGRIGGWQRLSSSPVGVAGSTPKSPAAGGLLIGGFQLGAYDSVSPDDPTYSWVTQDNGRGRKLVEEDGSGQGDRIDSALIDGHERNS